MKRVISVLVVMLLMFSMFVACGSSTTDNGTASTDTAAAPADTKDAVPAVDEMSGTLRIVASGNTDDGIDIATEIFKAKFPNANIELIAAPWGNGGAEMRNKELIMISSGDIPDVGKMIWGKEFFREGILVDITDEVKKFDIYPKYAEGQLERMTLDGKHFGITMGNNCIYQIYNKDILTKVGVTEAPKTYDELLALAKKIKDADLKNADGNPIYTANFEGGCWQTDAWLFANDGKQMSDDYSKTLIDSPESIKAFTLMQDFVKNGYAPKPDGSYDKLWLNGQLAIWTCGDWEIPATIDAKINAGYAVMPAGSSGKNTVSIGGVEYGIFKASKLQKLAIEYLKVITSTEFQMKFSRGVTDLTLYDNAEKQAAWKADGTLESKLVEKDQLKNSTYNFLEAPFIFPDSAKIYSDAMDKLLVRLDDPTATMTKAAADINKGIADASK